MKSEKILLLGNPKLHEISTPVEFHELADLQPAIIDLHDILFEFKEKFAHQGAFRAIAGPQIGMMKRLIYMFIDKPVIFINPVLENLSEEMFEIWDDCMCFPNLLVKLNRHKSLTVKYLDENWKNQELFLEGSLSELIQHEYDHLNGILATQRSIDNFSFRWRV